MGHTPTIQGKDSIVPNANDAELVRVYPRNAGGQIAEETIPTATAFEVVAEAEAGLTLFNGGGPYNLILTVEDLATSAIVHTASKTGNLHEAVGWSAQAFQFPFAVPAQTVVNDPYQARVVLTVGAADRIVEYQESAVFVIV
jgi:hypothetical protein